MESSAGDPADEPGLSKRARLVIIIVVAVALVAVPAAFRAVADRRADADLAAALAAGSAAAPQLDHEALWQAEAARFVNPDASGPLAGVPTLPRAHLVDRHIDPQQAVLVYEVSEWGEQRCLELVATDDDASARATRCPGGRPGSGGP